MLFVVMATSASRDMGRDQIEMACCSAPGSRRFMAIITGSGPALGHVIRRASCKMAGITQPRLIPGMRTCRQPSARPRSVARPTIGSINCDMPRFHRMAISASSRHIVLERCGIPRKVIMTSIASSQEGSLSTRCVGNGRAMAIRHEILIRATHMATCCSTTSRQSTDVIPAGRRPSKGTMAVIAGFSRFLPRTMAGRFTGGLTTIVTTAALALHGRAVVIAHTQPGSSVEMAALAGGVGDDMFVILGRGDHALADRMTAIAVARSTLEHTAHVTGFTRSSGMSAGKRESGGHVIEVPSHLFRSMRL